MIFGNDITVPVDPAGFLIGIIQDNGIRLDPPQIAPQVVKSHLIAEQFAQWLPNFGIDIIIRLHIADNAAAVINDGSVGNRATNDFIFKIHNRFVFYNPSDKLSVLFVQLSKTVGTAKKFVIIVADLPVGGNNPYNIAVIINDAVGANQISGNQTAVGNQLAIGQYPSGIDFAPVAHNAFRRYHAQRAAAAVKSHCRNIGNNSAVKSVVIIHCQPA